MRRVFLTLSLGLALIGAVQLVKPNSGVKAKDGEAKVDLAKGDDAKTDLAKDGDAKTELGGRF